MALRFRFKGAEKCVYWRKCTPNAAGPDEKAPDLHFPSSCSYIVFKRREPSLRFQIPHSYTCPYPIFIFPVRDGSTFPTCVAKLVVPESEDTERITAEFPCSPDVTNPVGGTKGFSQVIFDFVTAYNHEFPLHPDVEYVDTFNVGIVDAKVRVVIEEPGNFCGS